MRGTNEEISSPKAIQDLFIEQNGAKKQETMTASASRISKIPTIFPCGSRRLIIQRFLKPTRVRLFRDLL
jgi:hypothetical protein